MVYMIWNSTSYKLCYYNISRNIKNLVEPIFKSTEVFKLL